MSCGPRRQRGSSGRRGIRQGAFPCFPGDERQAGLAGSVPGHTPPTGPASRKANPDGPRDTEVKSHPQFGEQALQLFHLTDSRDQMARGGRPRKLRDGDEHDETIFEHLPTVCSVVC